MGSNGAHLATKQALPVKAGLASSIHGKFRKARVIAIDQICELRKFLDVEPANLGMFIADIAGIAAFPAKRRLLLWDRLSSDEAKQFDGPARAGLSDRTRPGAYTPGNAQCRK